MLPTQQENTLSQSENSINDITPPTLPEGLPQGQLTASKLALAQKCPGSFAVGHVQTESPGSSRGVQIHKFIEKLLIYGEMRLDLVADPEARKVCRALDAGQLIYTARGGIPGPVEILPEIAFAIAPDATEAVVLEKTNNHRDYSDAPEGYICGTADVVVVAHGGPGGPEESTAVITDWKSGGGAVPPAEQNLQLRFHALAASLIYGVEHVIAQIAYVGQDGAIHPSPCEFGPGDLQKISRELQEVATRVNGVRQDPDQKAPRRESFVVGEHCRHCPAFAACPAQAGAAQALLQEKTDELTPETAAAVWERLQAVEAATKKVRKALQEYVAGREEGIELPDGAELRVATSRRETIVGAVAMPVLRDRYGDLADKAATVTKKGLKELAGEEAAEVLQELEERRGIKTTYSESLRESRK